MLQSSVETATYSAEFLKNAKGIVRCKSQSLKNGSRFLLLISEQPRNKVKGNLTTFGELFARRNEISLKEMVGLSDDEIHRRWKQGHITRRALDEFYETYAGPDDPEIIPDFVVRSAPDWYKQLQESEDF